MTDLLRRTQARLADERGAVAVIVALLMVVLLGSSAMLFDLARLRHERHVLQGAVDLGSLAGAGFLPARGAAAAAAVEAAATDVAVANAPQLSGGALGLEFGCVVSDPEGDGGNDSTDLKFACGPAGGGGFGGWVSVGGKALAPCNPYGGDLCNTITLTASNEIDYFFAPILGINSGNTGAVNATACRGYCGQPSAPLDVVFVIDRTRSMSDADIANVKDAIADPSAAEDSVLEFYDPDIQRVGLVALPYHDPGNPCVVNQVQVYPNTAPSTWQLAQLSANYRNDDGSLNVGDPLVQMVACLQAPQGMLDVTPSGAGHTDHGDPIAAAHAMLDTGDDVPDVIVFFADGESNQPSNMQPCQYAVDAAAAAKADGMQGILVISLGYGAGGKVCNQDTTGYAGRSATSFLADVASEGETIPTVDDAPGGCAPSENTDGDYYFCESRGEDLEVVFRQIAVAAIQRTRLLNF